MIYNLSTSQVNHLLNEPETGMGYQVIEAKKPKSYITQRFIILNSQIAIEIDGSHHEYINKVTEDFSYYNSIKSSAPFNLSSITILNEKQFRNIINEPKGDEGAIDSSVENANGTEIFVRLSAFDDDRRIDKINNCLRPGSFTTTEEDYIKCKKENDNPVERYALPNNNNIKFAFISNH